MRKPLFIFLLLPLLLAGCAGSSTYMRDVAEGPNLTTPQAGKALVVFMRPSSLGFAVQSSVFNITSGEPEYVAIVSAQTKTAYQVDPGKHRFMVIGESADFMDANLESGKTYYALVTPRFGVWKARFSLRAVSLYEFDSGEFQGWYDDCRWVENTPEAQEWAQSNLADIRSKQAEYLPKWLKKPDKPMLGTGDGLDASESVRASAEASPTIAAVDNPKPAKAAESTNEAKEVPETQRRRVLAFFEGNEHAAKTKLWRYNERNRIGASPSGFSYKVTGILDVDVLDADPETATVKVTFALADYWKTPATYIYDVRWQANDPQLVGHRKP